MASRRKRLPVGTIHGWRLANTSPDGVSRNKSLSLCGNGSEDAVLVEPHAVGAAAVFCRLEARASNLWGRVSYNNLDALRWAIKYLAASAVPAGNGSALARSWRLVVLLDVLRWWWRLLAVWIWWRRSTRPLIGTW